MLKACIRLYKPLCRCRHSAVLPAASSVPVRPVKDSQEPQQLTQSAQFVLPRSWSSAVPQQRVRISRTSGHALRATAGVEHQCNDSHAEPQQQPQRVTVYFGADGVYTTAEPAENLWAVASKCGVSIPTSCNSGSCGTCEMEVRKWDVARVEGGTSIARTCIAAVPPGYAQLQLDALDDGIWGADGFDM